MNGTLLVKAQQKTQKNGTRMKGRKDCVKIGEEAASHPVRVFYQVDFITDSI